MALTTPITGLDHIELLVSEQAIRDYETLLGTAVQPIDNGAAIQLANVTVVLQRSAGLDGLGLICFEVDEPERMSRRLKRLGLSTVKNDMNGAGVRKIELDRNETYSVPLGYSTERRRGTERADGYAEILGLDHVVIATQRSDRATALYGARLGLDMRLDSTRPDWGVRLMFFRCGDLVLEVVENLRERLASEDDQLHGFSWRTQDADKTRARLTHQGFDVSDIRPGRRPGTRVFTVRNRTANIRTLFVELPKGASVKA